MAGFMRDKRGRFLKGFSGSKAVKAKKKPDRARRKQDKQMALTQKRVAGLQAQLSAAQVYGVGSKQHLAALKKAR